MSEEHKDEAQGAEQPDKKAAKAKAPKAPKGAKGEKGGEGGGKGGGGKSAAKAQANPKQPPRLIAIYKNDVVPKLMKDFGYKNPMQVPRLVKITVNMGLGEAATNVKVLDGAKDELRVIAGQQPVITKARKSIANFKLRSGMPIGSMVTLRHARMWEFLDRLMSVALPRVRDFKGVSAKAFDGRGNYALGVREQIIFPEINYDKIEKIRGMGITIVTTAKTDEEGRALLKYLGMPFRS